MANRVSAIRAVSKPEVWAFVRSNENPADVISRGCSVSAIPDMWLRGPQYLSTHKSDWPAERLLEFDILGSDCNVKHDVVPFQVAAAVSVSYQNPLDALIQHFSSFYKLEKSLAWLLRIKNIFVKTHLAPKTEVKDNLSVAELKFAEKLLVNMYKIKHTYRRLIL